MTEHNFASIKDMTAEDKEKVLKAWKQFLEHDFSDMENEVLLVINQFH